MLSIRKIYYYSFSRKRNVKVVKRDIPYPFRHNESLTVISDYAVKTSNTEIE